MNSSSSRKETERTKLIQEKCQTLLMQMLRDEDNKYCVDCDSKGPRWASWNLGVFLCIRCAGIHRNLGVHISRVKSVNLDTWTPEQVISLQQMGNSRARAVYEAQLPDGFRRPQTDSTLEPFIRAKYEHKKYLAREWVPPSPPKVDWGKEIEEELEKQKRKKKNAALASVTGGVITNTTKSTPLPAPLPKPKAGQSGSSPKTQSRIIAGGGAATTTTSASAATTTTTNSNNAIGETVTITNDLLGLSSPTKPTQIGGLVQNNAIQQDLQNDSFSSFLSAPPSSSSSSSSAATTNVLQQQNDGNMNGKNDGGNNQITDSLAKEEEDFFNQGSLGILNGSDKDKSGKLTKDSILALYGTVPTTNPTHHNPLNPLNPAQPQLGYGQSQQMFGATGAFASLPPHPQQPQYMMTPPNSASMFNTPVMTAPAAFSTGYHTQYQSMHAGLNNTNAGAFQQQPQTQSQQQMSGLMGIMPTGNVAANMSGNTMLQQSAMSVGNVNLMHTNQSLLSGMSMLRTTPSGQQQMPLRGNNFQATNNTTPANNLNQQFGNLNIGNVWQ